MGGPKIGDKLFIYGRDILMLDEFDEYTYNTVSGFATVGFNDVVAQRTDLHSASIPGFVVDFESTHCLTPPTPFSTELMDVTEYLSHKRPLPIDTSIWMRVLTDRH